MKKETLINLKESLDQRISPNKQKIMGALGVIPFIAASSMQGACASGCPYGMVNDPFPGNCSRYTDLNGDGICDLSQTITTATSDQTTTSTSDSSSSTLTMDNDGNGAHGSPSVDSDSSNATIVPDSGNLDSGSQIDPNNYHILPITLLLMGGYIFTYYLFKKGILKPQQHKRIWNLLLMGGYLGTGLTGILLTLMINLSILTIYNPSITYWHAELAILMVIGTLIHIHIYRKPFKNMFKVLFGLNFSSKKNNRKMVST
jgi:hypothetical protein